VKRAAAEASASVAVTRREAGRVHGASCAEEQEMLRRAVAFCSAAGSRGVKALEVQGSLGEERPVFTDRLRGERRNTG